MRGFGKLVIPRLLFFLLVCALTVGGERWYYRIHMTVVDLGAAASAYLYVPSGAGFEQVKDSLYKHGYISRKSTFEQYFRNRNPDHSVRPGRYRLTNGMTVQELGNMLSRGLQTPVMVTFHTLRRPEELAGKIGRQLEADSADLIRLMRDAQYLQPFGITPQDVFTITIPDSYEFWWNTTAGGFLQRMYRESGKFWNDKRTFKADSLRLKRREVVILASIVEKETAKNDEKPLIAGVYLNRLQKGWPLQADPTLIYAWNDFTIKRVLNRHKEIDSPYNTYKTTGLPPGPICLPSIASIDAVLNPVQHGYFYFCARDDFSGYHVFAASLNDHNRNAARYQKALGREGR